MADAFAPASAILTNLSAGQVTLKADVAKLKTDVTAIKADVATLKTDVTAIKADVAALPANIAALVAGNFAALLGVVSTEQRAALARRSNAVATSAPFVIVPLADGSTPAMWPAAFDRAALDAMAADDARALLLAYGEPAGPNDALSRRLRVARVIGAPAPS